VYAVADGIGTADVSRQAAWQLVDSLSFFFSAPEESFEPGSTMKAVISATHTTLQRLANDDRAGASMALIYVAPNHQQGYILSAGNSPVYMRRANKFHRLNSLHRDDAGQVSNWIGMNGELQVSYRRLRFLPGSIYLLCTDGVEQELTTIALEQFMVKDLHPQLLAEKIVYAADMAGGRDNATAIVLRFGSCPEVTMSQSPMDAPDR
jgi:serine/threonine protein phosphatase PrpC